MRSIANASNFIVPCKEAFEYSDRLWIFVEIMEAGKLTEIIVD